MRQGEPLREPLLPALILTAVAAVTRCRLDAVEAAAAAFVVSSPRAGTDAGVTPPPSALSAFRGPKRSSGRGRSDADEYGFDDDDTYGYTSSDFDEDVSSFADVRRSSGFMGTTTSAEYAVDPHSPEARSATSSLGLSPSQHETMAELAELVVDWNDRINLVSRKDCTAEVVFGRHVLPSASLCSVPDFPLGRPDGKVDSKGDRKKMRAVDVGTGGGFPGLPLAIAYPQVSFLLVDSVGKKLTAVQAMADELGLTNVQTHHGRVEEMTDDPVGKREHARSYDLCLGRSVTSLPRFCFWVQELLRRRRNDENEGEKEEGALVYIIGGDVEDSVTSRVRCDVPLSSLLGDPDSSDKRALVVSASDVIDIAAESGEVRKRTNPPGSGKKKKRSNPRRKRREAKGHWKDREDDDEPKQRGYENFKRYQA